MNIKASVIVPVYNAQETLERCAESILYGKERDIQLILVDDCSTDESWLICNRLAAQHNNVIAVHNSKNSGVSHTRNRGLREAAGKFVMFADSDDWSSGEFASEMIKMAQKEPERLVICGFHFMDKIQGESREYLWENSDKLYIPVSKSCYFDLLTRNLIQSVWNKIFRLDVIRQNNLSFDETQSMGEDFQFVLDYLRVLEAKGCMVINRPLYYYIRASQNSLMGRMWLEGYERGVERLEQLAQLSGQQDSKVYRDQIENQQKNFQYHIVHDLNSSREEKIKKIEDIMQDGKASRYYREQLKVMNKERIVKAANDLISMRKRVAGWMQRKKQSYLVLTVKKKIKSCDYSIFSQNCIGGVLYHDINAEFLSPTIDLYFSAEDFVKFVLNLKKYLSLPLEMSWGESYPVGALGDLTINFMHYRSCTDAVNAWERRKRRIQWDKIIVISTDREGFDDEVCQQWDLIPYPKVLFTAQRRYARLPGAVYYPEYEKDGYVPDLIPGRKFYKNGIMVDMINSIS